ncbi:hypothetical protein [Dongia deserti]|uniref:hypothetical protein n=1 Tax=Dongia deserti TaxID=2268030 RepID=UPI0013C41222|nr:hypothetical protein [Dongia deserti]
MPFYWAKKVLQRKREVTYGTDPVPAAADAALAHEVDFVPYAAEGVGRRAIKPWMGRTTRTKMANAKSTLSYFIEMVGAGAAGTAPKWGLDLRCCGFSETINVGVDVQYSPVSAAFDSMTSFWNVDGQRTRANGYRGSPVFEFTSGLPPRLRVAMTGLPLEPDDSAIVTPDFTGWIEPRVVNKVNTPTFTLHGFAAALSSLSIDMANVVAFRDWVNTKDVQITDRAPAGQVVIEAPTIAQKNFFSTISGETLGALQLIHGVAAGQIIQVDAPQVQLLNPRYGESQGMTTLTMDLEFHPSVGNDEVKITVK